MKVIELLYDAPAFALDLLLLAHAALFEGDVPEQRVRHTDEAVVAPLVDHEGIDLTGDGFSLFRGQFENAAPDLFEPGVEFCRDRRERIARHGLITGAQGSLHEFLADAKSNVGRDPPAIEISAVDLEEPHHTESNSRVPPKRTRGAVTQTLIYKDSITFH